MRAASVFAALIVLSGLQADPAVAGGGSVHQAHGAPAHQPRVHQQWQHSHSTHTRFGGPRLAQRADPNNQNPYRPMFSLNATNPGETHPYFRTRKDGFGYPPARSVPVYLGNGVYVIPR